MDRLTAIKTVSTALFEYAKIAKDRLGEKEKEEFHQAVKVVIDDSIEKLSLFDSLNLITWTLNTAKSTVGEKSAAEILASALGISQDKS